MWSRLLGRSPSSRSLRDRDEEISQVGKRSTHSSSRHRSGSVVSSPSAYKPSRSDDRGHSRSASATVPRSRSSYYSPESPSIASYATAPSNRVDRETRRDRSSSGLSKNTSRIESRGGSYYAVRSAKSGRRSERSPSRERRQHRRERSRSPARIQELQWQSRDRLKRGLGEDDRERGMSSIDYAESRAPNAAGYEYMTAYEEPAVTSSPAQQSIPAPSTHTYSQLSSHITDQFPGQDPAQYAAPYRPPLSFAEGGPGLAADYYGDHGESVAEQPGVRPQPPSLIVGAQPHLQAASPLSAPPIEPSALGGVGAAADFFNDGANLQSLRPTSSTPVSSSNRPTRPSKPTPPSMSGSAAAALTGSAGYAASNLAHSASHHAGSSSFNDEVSYSQGPAPPNMYSTVSSAPPGASPTVHHSSSAPAIPTLGAAAAGAATGYYLGHHSSHSHGNSQSGMNAAGYTSTSQPSQSQPVYSVPDAQRPSKPPRPGQLSYAATTPIYGSTALGMAGSAGSGNVALNGYSHGAMALQTRRKGPLEKFVEFWKDREGVAQYEEYTEYIGVCKDCFEPGTTARDAPRKHHYRRRKSNDRPGSRGKVDKERRYGLSDSEQSRRGKKSSLAAGLAGYGLGQASQTFAKQKRGFEDTYSVRSGKRTESAAFPSSDSRYGSQPRRDSSQSYGFYAPIGSNSPQRHRSRSRSPDRRNRVLQSGVAADFPPSVPGAFDSNDSSYPTSRREYVRSNRQSPSRMSGLASLFGLASSKASRNRRHRSPTPDSKYLKKSQAAGIVEGSVTKPFSRPGRSRKSKSFFNFGNSSSSSSASSSSADMGLAYGGGLSKSSRQGPRHANKAFNDDAAMIGLGVAAASVLSKRGKKNKADTRGDVPRKGSQLSSSDDAWESVSEAESSSVSSALAFGGASDSGSNGPRRHRKSSDSERSGISNWKWMFGGKRRTPSSASVDRPAQRPPKAGPIELRDSANSPTAPPLNYRQGAVPSYNARVPDMQYVVPVPTSDPSRFDVRRSDSVISSQTVNRSARPEPVPIQHTQPIVAVAPEKLSNFVESTLQGSTYEAPESATTAPTIHRKPYVEYRATGTENRERRTPVDPFQYLVQDSVPVENDQEVKVPTTRRRRASSPTFGSTDRDLASGQRAGVASYSDFQPRRVKPESRKPSLQRFQNNEKSQGRRQSSATTRTNEVFAAPLDDGNPQIVEIRPGRQNEPRHSSSDTPVSVNAAPSNPGPFVSSKENESSSDSRSHGQPQVELEQFRPEASPEGESPRSEYARSSRHPGDYVPDYHPLSDREAQAYVDSVMDKYNEEPQPVAAYFAPPELLSRKSDSPQSPDPNGDSNVTSSRVPQIVTIAPPVDHENDNDALQHAQFAGSYPYGALPWIVPRLNLIEPSPPPSTIGSTRDDRSAPISPVETKPNSSTGPEKSSESRVSWGDLQTKEYIVESSEEEPQKDDGDYHGHSSNQSTDESPEIHAHEYESHPVPESSSSGDLPQHVPGAFGEDVEFAATVAAGLEDSGFDPAIVIDDNNFRHRKSPPASHDFRFYHAPYAETVTDLGLDSPGTEGAPPRVGYVEGEVETPGTVTPVETKMHPKEISRSPSPTEEERAGSSARQLGAEREGDEFDRDSDRDSSDPERKVREIRPDVSTSSDKGAFEPGIESQIFENEKAQRHRNRNAQEFEAQISDSPVYETRSEVGKPPSNSKGSTSLRRRSWGPETQTAKSQRSRSQDSSPRELGRSNERFDDTPGFDMQIGTRRSSSSDIGVNPRSSGSQSIVSIPSNAFDDVEELADVKRPRKTKRASSRFGHRVPGSPLRSELAFRDDSSGSEQDAGEPNDLVRDAVVDDTEFTAQVPLPHELDEDAEELSGSTVREPEADVASAVFKRRGSFSSWGEAQDQPFEAPEEDKFYGWSDEELSKPRKRSSHRSRSRGKMEDESRLDGSRSSRASERPDSSASVHRSRSRGSNLEESSERTHRKRRSRRSSDVFGSPKPLTRSMSMSETEHRGHDDSHGSKRKSKRSSLDYNDLASVTSLPARLDDDKGSKREKRGGLFSFLTGRRSVDSLPALERSREIRSEELKPKSKRGSKEEEIGRDPYDIGDDAARSATSLPELSQKPSLEEESRESSSASGKKKKKKKHRHSSDIGTGTTTSQKQASKEQNPLGAELPLGGMNKGKFSDIDVNELPSLPGSLASSPAPVVDQSLALYSEDEPVPQPTSTPVDHEALPETLPHQVAEGGQPPPASSPSREIQTALVADAQREEEQIFPSLPASRSTSPIAVGSVKDLPSLPASRPTSPIDVGSVKDLPYLPESNPTSPIEVGHTCDLPSLPATRSTSPVEVGRASDLPALPQSRPNSPIAVGSATDLPSLPPTVPTSPIEVGHRSDLPSLPGTRPTSPIEVGHPEDLPSLPNSSPTSPIEVGHTADLPDLPDTRSASPIEAEHTKDLPQLLTTQSYSPTEIDQAKELPFSSESRPTTPIEMQQAADLSPTTEHRPTSPNSNDRLKLPAKTPERIQVPGSTRSAASPTAIPLHFSFRKGPPSPGLTRTNLAPTSPTPSQTEQLSPTRSRHTRPGSTEFKTSTDEFRPLYLVERNSYRAEDEPTETYPSLPSSRTSSRSTSIHDALRRYEHSWEEPHHQTVEDSSEKDVATPLEQAPEDRDIANSEASTPRAQTPIVQPEIATQGHELTTAQASQVEARPDQDSSLQAPPDVAPDRLVHSAREIFPDHDWESNPEPQALPGGSDGLSPAETTPPVSTGEPRQNFQPNLPEVPFDHTSADSREETAQTYLAEDKEGNVPLNLRESTPEDRVSAREGLSEESTSSPPHDSETARELEAETPEDDPKIVNVVDQTEQQPSSTSKKSKKSKNKKKKKGASTSSTQAQTPELQSPIPDPGEHVDALELKDDRPLDIKRFTEEDGQSPDERVQVTDSAGNIEFQEREVQKIGSAHEPEGGAVVEQPQVEDLGQETGPALDEIATFTEPETAEQPKEATVGIVGDPSVLDPKSVPEAAAMKEVELNSLQSGKSEVDANEIQEQPFEAPAEPASDAKLNRSKSKKAKKKQKMKAQAEERALTATVADAPAEDKVDVAELVEGEPSDMPDYKGYQRGAEVGIEDSTAELSGQGQPKELQGEEQQPLLEEEAANATTHKLLTSVEGAESVREPIEEAPHEDQVAESQEEKFTPQAIQELSEGVDADLPKDGIEDPDAVDVDFPQRPGPSVPSTSPSIAELSQLEGPISGGEAEQILSSEEQTVNLEADSDVKRPAGSAGSPEAPQEAPERVEVVNEEEIDSSSSRKKKKKDRQKKKKSQAKSEELSEKAQEDLDKKEAEVETAVGTSQEQKFTTELTKSLQPEGLEARSETPTKGPAEPKSETLKLEQPTVSDEVPFSEANMSATSSSKKNKKKKKKAKKDLQEVSEASASPSAPSTPIIEKEIADTVDEGALEEEHKHDVPKPKTEVEPAEIAHAEEHVAVSDVPNDEYADQNRMLGEEVRPENVPLPATQNEDLELEPAQVEDEREKLTGHSEVPPATVDTSLPHSASQHPEKEMLYAIPTEEQSPVATSTKPVLESEPVFPESVVSIPNDSFDESHVDQRPEVVLTTDQTVEKTKSPAPESIPLPEDVEETRLDRDPLPQPAEMIESLGQGEAPTSVATVPMPFLERDDSKFDIERSAVTETSEATPREGPVTPHKDDPHKDASNEPLSEMPGERNESPIPVSHEFTDHFDLENSQDPSASELTPAQMHIAELTNDPSSIIQEHEKLHSTGEPLADPEHVEYSQAKESLNEKNLPSDHVTWDTSVTREQVLPPERNAEYPLESPIVEYGKITSPPEKNFAEIKEGERAEDVPRVASPAASSIAHSPTNSATAEVSSPNETEDINADHPLYDKSTNALPDERPENIPLPTTADKDLLLLEDTASKEDQPLPAAESTPFLEGDAVELQRKTEKPEDKQTLGKLESSTIPVEESTGPETAERLSVEALQVPFPGLVPLSLPSENDLNEDLALPPPAEKPNGLDLKHEKELQEIPLIDRAEEISRSSSPAGASLLPTTPKGEGDGTIHDDPMAISEHDSFIEAASIPLPSEDDGFDVSNLEGAEDLNRSPVLQLPILTQNESEDKRAVFEEEARIGGDSHSEEPVAVTDPAARISIEEPSFNVKSEEVNSEEGDLTASTKKKNKKKAKKAKKKQAQATDAERVSLSHDSSALATPTEEVERSLPIAIAPEPANLEETLVKLFPVEQSETRASEPVPEEGFPRPPEETTKGEDALVEGGTGVVESPILQGSGQGTPPMEPTEPSGSPLEVNEPQSQAEQEPVKPASQETREEPRQGQPTDENAEGDATQETEQEMETVSAGKGKKNKKKKAKKQRAAAAAAAAEVESEQISTGNSGFTTPVEQMGVSENAETTHVDSESMRETAQQNPKDVNKPEIAQDFTDENEDTTAGAPLQELSAREVEHTDVVPTEEIGDASNTLTRGRAQVDEQQEEKEKGQFEPATGHIESGFVADANQVETYEAEPAARPMTEEPQEQTSPEAANAGPGSSIDPPFTSGERQGPLEISVEQASVENSDPLEKNFSEEATPLQEHEETYEENAPAAAPENVPLPAEEFVAEEIPDDSTTAAQRSEEETARDKAIRSEISPEAVPEVPPVLTDDGPIGVFSSKTKKKSKKQKKKEKEAASLAGLTVGDLPPQEAPPQREDIEIQEFKGEEQEKKAQPVGETAPAEASADKDNLAETPAKENLLLKHEEDAGNDFLGEEDRSSNEHPTEQPPLPEQFTGEPDADRKMTQVMEIQEPQELVDSPGTPSSLLREDSPSLSRAGSKKKNKKQKKREAARIAKLSAEGQEGHVGDGLEMQEEPRQDGSQVEEQQKGGIQSQLDEEIKLQAEANATSMQQHYSDEPQSDEKSLQDMPAEAEASTEEVREEPVLGPESIIPQPEKDDNPRQRTIEELLPRESPTIQQPESEALNEETLPAPVMLSEDEPRTISEKKRSKKQRRKDARRIESERANQEEFAERESQIEDKFAVELEGETATEQRLLSSEHPSPTEFEGKPESAEFGREALAVEVPQVSSDSHTVEVDTEPSISQETLAEIVSKAGQSDKEIPAEDVQQIELGSGPAISSDDQILLELQQVEQGAERAGNVQGGKETINEGASSGVETVRPANDVEEEAVEEPLSGKKKKNKRKKKGKYSGAATPTIPDENEPRLPRSIEHLPTTENAAEAPSEANASVPTPHELGLATEERQALVTEAKQDLVTGGPHVMSTSLGQETSGAQIQAEQPSGQKESLEGPIQEDGRLSHDKTYSALPEDLNQEVDECANPPVGNEGKPLVEKINESPLEKEELHDEPEIVAAQRPLSPNQPRWRGATAAVPDQQARDLDVTAMQRSSLEETEAEHGQERVPATDVQTISTLDNASEPQQLPMKEPTTSSTEGLSRSNKSETAPNREGEDIETKSSREQSPGDGLQEQAPENSVTNLGQLDSEAANEAKIEDRCLAEGVNTLEQLQPQIPSEDTTTEARMIDQAEGRFDEHEDPPSASGAFDMGRTEHTSPEHLKASIDVGPDYVVDISQRDKMHSQTAQDDASQSMESQLNPQEISIETSDYLDTRPIRSTTSSAQESGAADLSQPSPVESTTKDRDSGLFQASPVPPPNEPAQQAPEAEVHDASQIPEMREVHPHERQDLFPIISGQGVDDPFKVVPNDNSTPHEHAMALAALNGQKNIQQIQRPSLFGGPIGINSDLSSQVMSPKETPPPKPLSATRLNTIREASPEESPLSKRSKSTTTLGGTIGDELIGDQRSLASPLGSPTGSQRSDSRSGSRRTLGDGQGRISSDDFTSRLLRLEAEQKAPLSLSRARSRPSSRQSNLSSFSNEGLRARAAEGQQQRSTSAQSIRSIGSGGVLGVARSVSGLSNRSGTSTPSLRHVDRSRSGDLRAASKRDEAKLFVGTEAQQSQQANLDPLESSSSYDPVKDKGKGRAGDMADVYEGWGDPHIQGSPLSPSRPPSIVRRRQSMQIMDLETRLDQLASENRLLEDARSRARKELEDVNARQARDARSLTETVQARDFQLRDKDLEINKLKEILAKAQQEVIRLNEVNGNLNSTNRDLLAGHEGRYRDLETEHHKTYVQWLHSAKELEELKQQHEHAFQEREKALQQEFNAVLGEKDAQLRELHQELDQAREQVRALQKEILASKPSETFLEARDEDYFENACQKLCQHVQQWVLRFSKFSDMRPSRLAADVMDEKIADRLDNCILDGSDVDIYLSDRVRRRDVFMSLVMTMVWEYVFTRYLFGMDREQRQKLKSLEKTLAEVGPTKAVHRWRATTLTLLSKRPTFVAQRAQDTEAVVQEIYSTLSVFLPPPAHLERQVIESLRNVMRSAVELSIEMRTQRAEYIMLPPLQPEYDTNGDLARKVHFNAALMNERSGDTLSNEALEAEGAVVRMVLFPLVVKKGDDSGSGEDEIVVCRAQVLVAKPNKAKKVVRMLSGDGMSIEHSNRSMQSITPTINFDSGNMI